MDLKNVRRGRIEEYAKRYKCEFFPMKRPWGVKVDVALPCATQNELNEKDAATLVKNGVLCVAEGANMPSTRKPSMCYNRRRCCMHRQGPAMPVEWPPADWK